VINDKASRDRVACQFVRHPVRKDHPASPAATAELAVALVLPAG
jgi:hypothetical protein